MAREAMIVIKFDDDNNNVFRCIEILCRDKWSIYNPQDKVEILPIGDNGDYDWEEMSISWDEALEILRIKCESNEMVGLNLFSSKGIQGITLLSNRYKEITFSIDINRKSICDHRDSLTDFSWYFDNIILELSKEDNMLFAYRFVDFYD